MRINFQTLNSSGLLDKTGAIASWVCAFHCLAMPFVVSFLPLIGVSFLAKEGMEYIFIGFSTILAAITLLPAYFSQHHKIRTLILFVAGICLIIFADIIFEESLAGKIIFVLLGACLITSSHFFNRRLCAECRNCAETARGSLR